MSTKTGKKFCFVNHITDPASNTSSIIKDQQWRYATNEFKEIKQPLADTFSRFTAEYLSVSIIAVRERYSKIFLSDQFSVFIEISFSKINLGRDPIPVQGSLFLSGRNGIFSDNAGQPEVLVRSPPGKDICGLF